MAKCQECKVRRTRRNDRICDGCASKGLNVDLLRLYGKALKCFPSSPMQKDVDREIAELHAKLERGKSLCTFE